MNEQPHFRNEEAWRELWRKNHAPSMEKVNAVQFYASQKPAPEGAKGPTPFEAISYMPPAGFYSDEKRARDARVELELERAQKRREEAERANPFISIRQMEEEDAVSNRDMMRFWFWLVVIGAIIGVGIFRDWWIDGYIWAVRMLGGVR